MDSATQGLMSTWWNDVFDPEAPWHRPVQRDKRLFPARGGGRRMRHPYLEPIVYPELPHRTINFGYDVLRRVPVQLVRTADSTAVAKFPERVEDVVIREVWLAEELSTYTEFFHQLQEYKLATLPTGDYIGWEAPDLSPKRFAIDLLDVKLGGVDGELLVEELGSERPYYLREQLTVEFKLVREVQHPSGLAYLVGY
jgi:hypothetical protein